MRIFDTFLFRDELDLLECRLVQMENWPVYRHVLVESPLDHQGHPKPLYFYDNRERFAPWADRITHVIADLPERADPMSRTSGQLSTARRDGWSAGPEIHDAGHHLTWLGGQEGIAAKMAAHCHVECNEDLARGNAGDVFYQQGQNPFGKFGYTEWMKPVDVDETWPRWVYERRCPPGWFRPRS